MPRRDSQSRLKRKLLIVEDEGDLRLLFAEHFESAGYHVETARDGNEAIAKALKLLPHVIILDLEMPYLDGWDTIKILSSYTTTRDIPLLACTGTDAEGQQRAMLLGCGAIARKPCSPELVEAMVNDLLGGASDHKASDAS